MIWKTTWRDVEMGIELQVSNRGTTYRVVVKGIEIARGGQDKCLAVFKEQTSPKKPKASAKPAAKKSVKAPVNATAKADKKHAVESQTERLNTVLRITAYDAISQSYWIVPVLENGEAGDEVEWIARYPFKEHELCARISLADTELEGDPTLVMKFRSEPTMVEELRPSK